MDTKVQSNSEWRDGFIIGAARLFFVSAYADYVESDDCDDDLPRASGGGDWYDVAPSHTPINAFVLAGELWASLEHANKCSVYVLGARAHEADGGEYSCDVDPEEFGRCLAWMYMGSGVSWFDDHAQFEIEVPYAEISYLSFDFDAYNTEGN